MLWDARQRAMTPLLVSCHLTESTICFPGQERLCFLEREREEAAMESFGLVALIALLALAMLLIGYRLTTMALRLARFSRLKRTTMILPAVRPQPGPQPRSPFSTRRVSSRRVSSRLPIEVVIAHPTLPPERNRSAASPYSDERTIKRLPHDTRP
jgi:hypothetical protein